MRITQLRPRKVMRRPCKVCGKMFHPTGKFSRYCEQCTDKSYNDGVNKRKLKFKMDKQQK